MFVVIVMKRVNWSEPVRVAGEVDELSALSKVSNGIVVVLLSNSGFPPFL